jgi:hypothetical protein
MKTISGKNISINESINEGILSSTKSGRESVIADFCKDHFYKWQYQMNNDMSVNLLSKEGHTFLDLPDIPVWVKESAGDMYITECGITHLYLPIKGKRVIIEGCNKLEKIETKTASEIEELVIKNCGNIDLSGLSKELNIKKVRILKCGITTLNGLENITKDLQIKNCSKLRDFDIELKNSPVVTIQNCPLRNFSKPLNSVYATITTLQKSTDLDIKIGNVEDLRIENSNYVKMLKFSGNYIDTLVVEDCDILEKIELNVDCKTSASFITLPKITEYILPKRISGVCVFENVLTVPENIVCRRKLIR